jgi:predicted TIM-barrel fold metal-dependent hydrolase
MNRRDLVITAAGAALLGSWSLRGSAEEVSADRRARTVDGGKALARGPIIDVHMHAYPPDAAIPAVANPMSGQLSALKDGEAHLQTCLAEMKRLNIVKGVVSGGSGDRLAAAMHWTETDPTRFIAGAGIRGSADTPLPEIAAVRKQFEDHQLRVLGEVTAQYAGLSLNDSVYEPYLALAEEFDAPVALHTGMGPPGISHDPCCQGFRARLGNPALLEDVLNRHPKLRVNLMHAGWPYLQDTIATMFAYPQVNVDLGALGWSLPRAEFHSYLGALMRAGFGKRIMFGSDHMYWPDLIGAAVDAVDSAASLTANDKRDIFYNNAVRFFRFPDA